MHSPAKTQNTLLTILWPSTPKGLGLAGTAGTTDLAGMVGLAGKPSFPSACESAPPIGIETAPIPAPVYVYEQVTSTLDVVHELASTTALPPWASVLAHSQTGGRGQLRRAWVSPSGNLYAALHLPAVQPFTGAACAPAVGCLIAHALRRMGFETYVKWPNDLVLWQGQQAYKIGGILVEEHQHGIWAGIGINILHSPPKSLLRADYAMSASHLGALMPSLVCSEEFHNTRLFWMRLVEEAFSWYETGVFRHDSWCEPLNAMLLWRGSMVSLCTDNSNIYAKLLGISPSGAVNLERDGVAEDFFCGSLRACKPQISHP